MTARVTVRRALFAAVLAPALCVVAPSFLANPAHAQSVRYVAPAEECAADDKACKDKEDARQIDEQQKETEAAADKAGETIKDVGKQIDACKPGSGECMTKLTGPGMGEKEGIADMTGTIDDFRGEPANNASAVVTSTCSGFAASLPAGSADDSRSPFPVDQLCSLLDS
ncbi:hypothetical protein [Streptomyces sp. NPDC059209]|uniref:hypothetical protein n=2 Tax=unclassified Streptomyces TaxID=2593676 RepID=UPI0036A5B644